jgi:hypothetical protein
MKELLIPLDRASYASKMLVFNKKNNYGYGLKLAIREAAKQHPLYHMPIKTGSNIIELKGMTDSGEEIPVNTLGRWIFGVPGYMGHCIFAGGERIITIYIPENSPKEVKELLTIAVNNI